MKKLICLGAIIALTACAQSTGEGNGIVKVDQEPKNCEFLYDMNTSVTMYDKEDAYDYLEKNIKEDNKLGDTYYIAREEIVKNEGAIFGPKNTYKLKAKVYSCKN